MSLRGTCFIIVLDIQSLSYIYMGGRSLGTLFVFMHGISLFGMASVKARRMKYVRVLSYMFIRITGFP